LEVQVSLGAAVGVSEDLLCSAVELVLRDSGVEEGEISVALLEDQAIRDLNREYLGRDRPTDVIAFALHEGAQPVLGDIYVGFDQAVRQADEMSVPLNEELARLAIHGALHVLGHDHPESDARFDSEMFLVQDRLLLELLDEVS
jgi:probable rRNA maturation factor